MERDIMLVLGILVLCSFFTFTAISFRKHRLPKKKLEYQRIRSVLGVEENADGEQQLISEIFQTEFKGADYILPVCFVTLFCCLGFWVLFAGDPPLILSGVSPDGIADINHAELSYGQLSLVAIGMAILGSYIWSIQYIVRRLINLDLIPGAYYSIGTRIIFATFVSVVMHHFIQSFDHGTKKELLDVLPVLAFLTGIFPQRVLQYLHEKVFFFSKGDKKAHKLPLDMIEGITLFSRVRLAEVGIDNAQNLAEANIRELILKTPFNPLLLLDWIAQARLYVTVKDRMDALRRAFIRTVFDLQAVEDDGDLERISRLSEIEEEHLSVICDIIREDPKNQALDAIRKRLSKL